MREETRGGILRILYDRNSTKEGIWKGGMDERVLLKTK